MSCNLRRWIFFAIAIILAGSQPRTAIGQVLYGSIVGNVTDPSDAPVPGGTVVITHAVTSQARQAVTNEAGGYSFPTVPSGLYTIRVTKEGFQTSTRRDVEVTINSVARADIKLQIGAVTEAVQVTSEVAALQTDRSEVRSEIGSRTLHDLPIPLGRNYQNLFVTVPGFAPPRNAHSIPSNPSRALVFNVNGTSYSSNNTRIDGASSTNVWLPHATAYVPSLEAIETVNVVTNSFDAEQGLAGGSAINVQIKSGTNDLHGSVFGGHFDNRLKAKNFFTPQGERNPKNLTNNFGGTLGGPIRRDKLFYFASYEGTFLRQFASRFANLPTAAMLRGDMSASANAIYDPMTGNPDGSGRTPFPDSRIPGNRIDSIAAKIAALIPAPNVATNSLSNNYYTGAPFSFDRQSLDSKINWNTSSRFNMYGRFSVLWYSMTDPQMFGPQLGGPPISSFGGNPGHGSGGTYTTSIAANYVASPKFIVDGNFGYTRMDTSVEQPRLDEKVGLDFLGIPGTNGPRRFEGGWPRFSISDFTSVGINEDYMPYFRRDPQYQYVANASWTKGTHSIRFGVDFYRLHLNHTQPEFSGAAHGASGGFTFGGGPTGIRNGPSTNQYNNVATFLLGVPTTIGRILQVPDEYTTRTWSDSVYFRDQWQATHKLTLSMGLRWEYFPMPTRADRGMERYDINANKMLVCGVGVVPKDCGVAIGKRNFAPRLGIAWRATDTFVVRAGYGITNDPFNVARSLRTNYPVALALNVTGANSFTPAGTLRTGIPQLLPPDLGNGVIDMPRSLALNTLPEQFNRGYIQSWNLTLQKQLPKGFTGQVGYVATRQVRQLGFIDVNVGRPGGGNASRPLNQRFGRTVETQYITPTGSSHFDSLQATFERRFSAGYQFQASYTWSKSIGIAGNDNSDSNPRIQIPEYYYLNRTVSGFDRAHNFAATAMAELPFGKRKRWLNRSAGAAIAGGWHLNAVFSAYSGAPFTVTSSGNSLDAPGNGQQADQVLGEVAKIGGAGPGQSFFDPLAYRPVTQARFGTSGINALRGPGVVNLDLGLFREFAITERWRLSLRAESFNFTNTPHFSNPGANVSNLQLNNNGTIRSLNGFTEITSTSGIGREGVDERLFRVGLAIRF